jgi:hypothetical protein
MNIPQTVIFIISIQSNETGDLRPGMSQTLAVLHR